MDWMICTARGRTREKWGKRKAEVHGMIIHTTGAGLYNRWKRDNPKRPVRLIDYTEAEASKWSFFDWRKRRGEEATPFDTAIRVYASLMDAGPHFVVCGETGRVCQMSELDRAAWHVGKSQSWRYKFNAWKKKCPWWQDRWPELDSPRDFMNGLLWKVSTCNDLTIGVEVAPPRAGANAPWSKACLESLAEIYRHCKFYAGQDITVLTHSDVHPYSRTSKKKPTDPGEGQWDSSYIKYVISNH